MKSLFYRILGVSLPIAMVLALAVMLLPAASTEKAEAAEGTLRFGTIPLPKHVEDGGKYQLVHDVDVGPLAVSPEGNVLFAAAANISTNAANMTTYTNDLLKSGDGGRSWTRQAGFAGATTGYHTDNTSIVAIAISPEYGTDTTLLVATDNAIYQSVDGGTTFSAMTVTGANLGDGTETITAMDVIMDSGGRLSVIIGTNRAANGGDVYVYSPATTGMSWQRQTIGASNVLAVAFSPNFPNDEGICAVTINGTDTLLQFAFGNTKTGGGWGTSGVGSGKFLTAAAGNVTAEQASIAFPDDFDVDSINSNIVFVGLADGTAGDATTEAGDVYKVTCQPGAASTTEDLNVRGLVSTIRTATNIYSIDVTGDAEAATIVVGTNFWSTGVSNYYWTSYISTDSGVTWTSAREKAPTGGTAAWDANGVLISGTDAACNVVLAPDFATSGLAYAGTTGADTSAFSRTVDGGKSWNQISFIDYTDEDVGYIVRTFSVQSDWAESKTALMTTALTLDWAGAAASGGSCWKTTDGGARWERIWSYANPTATTTIDAVSRAYVEANIGETVFAKDPTTGKWWRSTDYGATFPRLITGKAAGLVGSFEVTPDMIWSWYWTNAIWRTTNLGRPWEDPDESIIAAPPVFYAFSAGPYTLVPAFDNVVYVSADGGTTFTQTLGVTNIAGATGLWLDPDANYAENKYLYAIALAGGNNVWRIAVDESDPNATEWMDISGTTLNVNASTGFIFNKAGVVYIVDGAAANLTGGWGGIWRSVNMDADLESVTPPEFELANAGLNAGDTLAYKSVSKDPTAVFCRNGAAANYWNQIVGYKDTLSSAVTLTGPDDGASEAGIRLSTTDLTQTVILSWGGLAGATQYEWEVCNDEACESVSQTNFTTGQEIRVDGLIPGKTYYWRLRATAPTVTPWSEVRSFTVADVAPIDAPEVVVAFDVVSPERGASGIPVQPVFVWTAVEGAEGYELVVAEDKTFAIIEWSHTADSNFYQGDEILAYATTYYWRVRASGGEWANGVFTTVGKAVEEEPAVVTIEKPAPPPEIVKVEVPGPAAAIPDWTLYTIIAVGAVLVIALIVLIVRTRRVT